MSSDQKILFVDDEPNVLQGFRRQLRGEFLMDIAEGSSAGLRAMEAHGPYAVVVTDMRMPSMNGIEFLRRIRQQWPDTIRLMLTGISDQQTAIAAVNEGCVFRFLSKPCSRETLTAALSAALEQHALESAERELLCKSLSGSVNLHAELISLLNPADFGGAESTQRLCNKLCARLEQPNVAKAQWRRY